MSEKFIHDRRRFLAAAADAFDNRYWPALYFADAEGRVRRSGCIN